LQRFEFIAYSMNI